MYNIVYELFGYTMAKINKQLKTTFAGYYSKNLILKNKFALKIINRNKILKSEQLILKLSFDFKN